LSTATFRSRVCASALTLFGAAGAGALAQAAGKARAAPPGQSGHGGHEAMPMPVGEVDHERNGFNPSEILTDFDYGEVSTLDSGQTLREYRIASGCTFGT